jgi:cold shock CspA family protein
MSRDLVKDHGVVLKWNVAKAFGFIKPAGGGRDVFIHIRGCIGGRALEPGQQVAYFLAPDRIDPSKVMAVDCTVIE